MVRSWFCISAVSGCEFPGPLAGVPKYPAPPQPALATVVIAIAALIAASVLRALIEPGPDADPNASAGGVAPNPWALLSLASDLNAGVVEEIILVAVPVLVGRRAGWHPAWILGLAMVLRWPFHIYQGVWTTLPWAMVWGGAFAAAFLYLRRLWPLVAVHFLTDAQIRHGVRVRRDRSAGGDPRRLRVRRVPGLAQRRSPARTTQS